MNSALVWEEYNAKREQLQNHLAEKIRRQMSSMVGSMENADLLLVAADGKKLPAHECILRTRAPGFHQRHVEATLSAMGPRQEGKLREVAVGDIDSVGLEFFIHSVYTEEEIAQIPIEPVESMHDSPSPKSPTKSSSQSFSDKDFQLSTVDGIVEDETPTLLAGHSPYALSSPFGTSSHPSSPRKMMHAPQVMSTSLGPLPEQPSFHNFYDSGNQPAPNVMTSFRDLASGCPMNSSIYSLGGRSEVTDIPEEDEQNQQEEVENNRESMKRDSVKFIRLDSIKNENEQIKEYHEQKRHSGGVRQMFPMFIGLSEGGGGGYVEKPTGDAWRSTNRLSFSKRLSMTSLTSLTSIDITPGQDAQPPSNDMTACSKLAADLMRMYVNNEDTDCVIRTEGGDLHAHKCILSATCPFFRHQLQKSKRVEMRGFSKNSINFLLSFLYGGVTTIPNDVDVWEVVSLATHLNHKDLAQVVILHLKVTKCHWFHRPCASCVSSIFECLPQLGQIRCLKPLYDEALAWQAKHFARIWKGRVFLYLNEKYQKECYEAIVRKIDEESVIDIILGCERLQVALSRSKSEYASTVLQLVDDILDVAIQVLLSCFNLVVVSESFRLQGKGLALNLNLLEDLLPSLVHSLTADVAIKTFIGLSSLLDEVKQRAASPERTMSIPLDKWSPRFLSLVKRLYELSDRHLLHYAASVIKSDAYQLLTEKQKQRINDTGIFVEIRQPKAPPPRLSSNSRSYKRSASVGVQNNGQFTQVRARSAERTSPLKEQNDVVPVVEEQVEPVVDQKVLESPMRRSRSREKSKESIKMKKSAPGDVKKTPLKTRGISDEMQMERQTTHTIITVDKAKASQLPGPDSSPAKVAVEKPKSVVKPMMKDSPLASSANKTVIKDRISARKPLEQPKVVAGKSAIPTTTTKPKIPRPGSGGTSTTKTTRSTAVAPKPGLPQRFTSKRESNSIEKN